jgi:LmbE family N-acetylglucosaminyl deacetylase
MTSKARLVPVWIICAVCLSVGRGVVRAYDWLPTTNKIVVLSIMSHPDDEGIFFGGALPYYSSVLNLPTMLVCMTGTDPIRQDELRCAAWTYGLRYEPLFGHFTEIDSGVVTNNPYTNTIDLTWDWWSGLGNRGTPSNVEVGKARAINYIAEQIRRYRPEVIFTQDLLNGETGHDNHKATAYAVTQAFVVAADPDATAPNLVGLPPWQAQKLYVHLYPTNRLFHEFWETPSAALTNQTPHQVVNLGLTCHVSQGPLRWTCVSVYPPVSYYSSFVGASEWWGLYASMVGPDTVLSSNTLVKGYAVPSGVAAGSFLEHLSLGSVYSPPAFTADPLILPPTAAYDSYRGGTLADYCLTADSLPTLTFSKVSGPDWLVVGADGTLSGRPSRSDAGTNSWTVRVRNQSGLIAQTTLTIPVLSRAVGMEDLMGWWRLSETNASPPVVPNSAPLSPDGVSYGGMTFGQAGARPWTRLSVEFNGTNGKIDVPYSAILNPPVFTVAFWANAMGGSGTYRSPLTSRKDPPVSGYIFYAGPNNLWQFWTGNGSGWRTMSAGPVVLNTWIHLAATYDGSTIRFYTNGTLAATANGAVRLNDSCPLRIGAGATEGAGNYWFPGCVDDVRVYRVALDSAHIWGIFASPPVINYIRKQSDSTILLGGTAVPEQTYILLASASRGPGGVWMPVATNTTDPDGNFEFADADATSYLQRFYRLIMP